MKQDIKQAWVTALRSGDYKQGLNGLHHIQNDKYCCLGVLCDLAEKAGVVASAVDPGRSWRGYITREREDLETSGLPVEVQEWAGLDEKNPRMKPHSPEVPGGRTVIGLNDTLRYNFSQIADAIEKSL